MNNNDYFLVLDSTEEYLNNLSKSEKYKYYPCMEGRTDYGNKLELGFSTFALKILKMLGKVDEASNNELIDWANFLNSFQTSNYKEIPNNFYVDPQIAKSYVNLSTNDLIKDQIKKVLNIASKKYDTNLIKFKKSVNAETKQTISTLNEIGFTNNLNIKISNDISKLNKELKNLNWDKPWSAGGQFSTYCVYSDTQKLGLNGELYDFASSMVNNTTGSYYKNTPKSNREIINGAMKVISGLAWIDKEIHYPKKLIDFCLKNKPILEGCDVVDYVYVLFMCSQQIDYKKKDINIVLMNTLDELMKLYKKEEKGFSYFINKSQTHYYGVQISQGKDCADIQSTTLCVWAIIMILKNNEILDNRYKTIKP
tara:strand:+ start:39 stop:1139 length:1101 start_codon:yes stop_codon:yes gene_type:complete